MSCVLFVDCDQIQRYITSSGRLRDIRGASARLAWVNETKTKELLLGTFPGRPGNVDYSDHPFYAAYADSGTEEERKEIREIILQAHVGGDGCEYELLFSAGGITKVVFEARPDAETFEKAVRHLYNTELPGAEITTHIQEVDPGADKPVAGAVTRGERRVRSLKDNKSGTRVVVSSPFFHLCDACGQEPASVVATHSPGLQAGDTCPLICEQCEAKRSFLSSGDQDASPLVEFGEKLCEALREAHEVPAVKLAPDFSQVASPRVAQNGPDDAHDTDAYMGLICADGNNMGQIVANVRDRQFRGFSQEVKEATTNALREAAQEVLGRELERLKGLSPNASEYTIPFQPLILGGDDIVCVVKADRALELAEVFVRRFHEITVRCRAITAVAPNGITIAAGVAIAKAKFPFYDLHDLAETLLREAKARCREVADSCAVDFLVVSSPRAPEFTQLRELRGTDSERTSCRPYLVSEAGQRQLLSLLQAVRTLKGAEFPRSKLNDLTAILRRGQAYGYQYKQWLGALQGAHREAWGKVCVQMGVATADWESWPAVVETAPGGDATADHTFADDLNEIYDFVPREDE